ncbi:uracil-DNA glycosylase [Neisseria musculi]|uniref:Uracil-DNA glycosylase n=2 Tax=Neisseriaceae TaxID=481 RepID=A0A7H1MCL5_9NEIS|nr:uracil-DNA glycosylase [Neisseria musculi]MBF0804984.1 uracil-DNA glycosylase [Neisseria sp. 19428wB4_WF04]QNT59380.1 uracil-DNA glycosylase [Neisseria musculi]TFU39291.1 uracil-DNA glycosylase [Neisseria sp. WF04]
MQTWQEALGAEKQQPYFQHILNTVKAERISGQTVYPPAADVFNAFKATEFGRVKVVVLGQDPYHGAGQAHGLAFSVRPEVDIPPSLANIYKELAGDIEGFLIPNHGCLQHWAQQGVLLLNTVLTVRAHQAHSHAALGWEQFTDRVIEQLNEHRRNVVFMLWGSHAQKKGAFIDRSRHLVLSAPHPSPLSAYRGFFGCRHFSQANAYLQRHGLDGIDWQV